MRLFRLHRIEDVSGVSGVGYVAEGVVYADGTCAIRWYGEHASTVIWSDIADAEAIHGHGGRTRFEWLD